MNQVTLLQPPRIVFGNGSASQCVEYLVSIRSKRPLLFTGKSVWSNIQPIIEALKKAGIETAEGHFVPAEPTLKFFETAIEHGRKNEIDAVLAIGGGSVIDVAKLTAALARGSQNITEVFGINLLAPRAIPLVCLPTTAGTGAEVSPNAILLDEGDEIKKGVVSPYLVPDAAFIDPLLTLSVPPAVTAATGLDALTHCIEAYANKFSHPIVDVYALNGVKLIAENLRRAVHNGADVQARAAMALGSLYGGLCLGPVNTAAVHALAYPLGGRYHIPHGVANALLLPHVLRFNYPAAPERYAEISLALGVAQGDSSLATAEKGVDFLFQISRECGVPQKLSDLSITSDSIPGMAQAAMRVTRLLKNNLRPLTEADAEHIYQAAY